MYTAMIVEDEAHLLHYLKKKLMAYETVQITGAFLTPEEAWTAFVEQPVDVVFLDVEMPRMNGIKLARKLLEVKEDLCIIFTTAYDQYALDAFEVEALDYLVKPITDADITRTLKRVEKVLMRKAPQLQMERVSPLLPVSCFACFDVRDVHQQLVRWPTRKTEEVFAYLLAHQGKHVSKWELLELFWLHLDETRGLHNLHSTIYRIKQVLKRMTYTPTIRKINDGYFLESPEIMSDLGKLLQMMKLYAISAGAPSEETLHHYYSYIKPLFGSRDYPWSFSVQKKVDGLYAKFCEGLLDYYYKSNQFEQAERIISYYILQHIEDEAMLLKWLHLLQGWEGYDTLAAKHMEWFNEKLTAADLPLLV